MVPQLYNDILVHAHSGLRWLVLILLVLAIVNALAKRKKNPYTATDFRIALFAFISTHLQLLIGLILYISSPKVQFAEGMMKNSQLRFYSVEHIIMMLLAIALITIGYGKAKRATEDSAKFKAILTYYGIGLLLILAAIPWPFRDLGAGWF